VCAYIVPDDPAPTVQELNRLCTSSDDLASYMCPRYYAFVDELPRNATGKKLHVRLREQAARDLAEGRLARP
jgi:acyl-CoA synthetase (AMP-forming)/AMP-acid ligase II